VTPIGKNRAMQKFMNFFSLAADKNASAHVSMLNELRRRTKKRRLPILGGRSWFKAIKPRAESNPMKDAPYHHGPIVLNLNPGAAELESCPKESSGLNHRSRESTKY
jgi:hypothetical protein